MKNKSETNCKLLKKMLNCHSIRIPIDTQMTIEIKLKKQKTKKYIYIYLLHCFAINVTYFFSLFQERFSLLFQKKNSQFNH